MKLHVQSPTREILASKAGAQLHVTAVYVRTGERRSANHPYGTVLLQDIRDAETGELLTDHMWFNHGQVWRSANLCPGDVIAFDARSIEYRTGYWGPNRVRQAEAPARRDYRLTPPKGLTIVAESHTWSDKAA